MFKAVPLPVILASGFVFLSTVSQVGCSGDGNSGGTIDAGSTTGDAGGGQGAGGQQDAAILDARPSGGSDAGAPGGSDAGSPGGSDAGSPGGGSDAGSPGGGSDAGSPGGGSDAGSPGGGSDAGSPGDPIPAPVQFPVDYVDPFVGTDDSSSPNPVGGGAGGSTYPGAVVPFGMVQVSPDTPTASPSGYRYSDTQIEQFSLTHFDGAGCPNNEDLPFLPFSGTVTTSPAGSTAWSTYRVTYNKANEQASPGYYHVKLNTNIDVELTATTRTAMVRMTYPTSLPAQLLLHTGRSATGDRPGSVEIVDDRHIRGMATAGGFCGSDQTYSIYFAAEFDAPFTARRTWLGTTLSTALTASGVQTGAVVTFDSSSNPTVQMKVALSFVSVDNAAANLAAENPAWDFDAVRTAAMDRWNTVLRRIEVGGGSSGDLKKFYTALYHVFQSPNVASDVNGDYMGFDKQRNAPDWTVYQNYSGWDIIRSWTHLISAVAPEAPDIIRSMVEDGIESGLLPFWTQQNVETHVMVGDPGTVNVANAYAMGVRGFDTSEALRLMLQSATDPNNTQRSGLDNWMSLHFTDNAAVNLEYAMADFSIAQFAGSLGDTATHDAFMTRSGYWKDSWNATDGYIESKFATPSGGANAARIYEVEVYATTSSTNDLALGQATTASGQCNSVEIPSKAVNGTWDGGTGDKWCDNTSANKWWQVDLGAVQSLSRIVIHHASDGRETAEWNTQDFVVSVSADGTSWTVVAHPTVNTAGMTTHDFTATDARYVRLDIIKAIQIHNVGDFACQPFDPASECGFVEGNAAQYLWMVPHNLEGLFTQMGGHANAIARLDTLFTELNAGTSRPFFYIGNEPEHGTPWSYNFAQAPWKTQDTVRRIVDDSFLTTANGLPGNDDLGATSAWLVWAYLGMYPMIPGTDVLVVHGTQFPSVTVHLANGHTLNLRGDGSAVAGAHFIQGMRVNGTATTRSWLRFSELAADATLQFTMGTTANASWGSAATDVPPSFP